MNRYRETIAVLAITLWVGGCEWVLGIEEGKLREESTPPDPTTPDCVQISDCVVEEPACRTVVSCTNEKCVYQDEPEGKPLPSDRQTSGDCLVWVCDDEGNAKQIPDAVDNNDMNICTNDVCNENSPVHMPVEDVPCYSGPAGTENVGPCKGGIQKCKPDGTVDGTCDGEVLPGAFDSVVHKNGIDDDCDGEVDEDPDCGDGIVQPELGEECDDGGTADGDPCSPTCKEQRVLAISAGWYHTCALLVGGAVKCWGQNGAGQLGAGDVKNRGSSGNQMGGALPLVNLGDDRRATAVVCGAYHTCALTDDKSLKCWGGNSGGLGLGDVENRGDGPGEMGNDLPVLDLGTGSLPMVVTAGNYYTCALLNFGSIKCWGNNGYGQLGQGDTVTRGNDPGEMGNALQPVSLGTGQVATAIVGGFAHACALLNDGNIKCWGRNYYGQLGLADAVDRGDNAGEMGDALSVVQLGAGQTATDISLGEWHSCARLSQGSIKCWGRNDGGQLGLGTIGNRGDAPGEMGDALPVVDLGASNTTAIQVSSGGDHTCALLADGRVKCWGAGGRLGLGDKTTRGANAGDMGDALPFVDLGLPVVALATGRQHTCALLANGTVKCWGRNNFGQLGLGDIDDRGDEPNEMGDNLPTVKLYSNFW